MSTQTRPSTGSFPQRRLRPEAAAQPVTTRAPDRTAGSAGADEAGRRSGPASGPGVRWASTSGRPARVGLVVLMPAYQPDGRLVELVSELVRELPGCRVLVVDDGSGPQYAQVFREASARGAEVVGYESNRGKGAALRTGLAQLAELWPGADVVCADADGQHRPADIAAVARRVRATGHMTLGVRRLTGPVPLRSRIGNAVTSLAFRLSTGWRLGDTQTGLRGYPAGQTAWLAEVPGDRYEYELSVLLRAHELGLEVEEVEIATVYEPGNASSHFRPLRDSARVYAPMLGFLGASLVCFGIDWVGVVALHAMTGNLLASVVGARLVSGTVNFVMNRRVFHAAPGTVCRTAVRYVALALVLLAASYMLLRVLTGIGVPLGLAKLLGDGALYAASYVIQRRAVFR
ncbi:dolichyl-phosphate beta-D-mannosyltransferase [Actinomyces sp. 432]|uniref:bifunctional glycosyltransferase family 2/GtrA family protein n=1 Tax=Actinomyces sp. 432 TaxID=2057798 RepID=UPI001373E438|nr:bifunctional glycosyltransferase family 2/GtrA family protein [Actinomyces sp. 432]QHO91808.1 dolichyl-phosphate beta-D-mannosyltransferase [Actinomyces sp. 432]